MDRSEQLSVRPPLAFGRRDLLVKASAAGLALSVPGTILSACGGSSDGGTQTLSVGSSSTQWVPDDLFIKNTLEGIIAWGQISWMLFMGAGSGWAFRNAIASGYRVSDDGKTHTVTLRKGMTFHNGRPIDADAVAANLSGAIFADDPLHEGEGPYVATFITLGEPPVVRSVEAIDARTVQLRLSEYREELKTALALIPIVDPELFSIKNYGTNAEAIDEAGSGPFRLTSYQPGDHLELRAYPDFVEPPETQRMLMRLISDPGAMALALTSGEIDVAAGLAKADFDNAVEGGGYEAITSVPAVNFDLIFSHFKDPAFKDPSVRKAFVLAMNRKAYVERFFSNGTAEESSQPIVAPGSPGYNEDIEPLPFDPDRAKQLLAEAGLPNPRITLTVPTSQPPLASTKGLAEAIAAETAAAGFRTEIQVLDHAAYSEALEAQQLELWIEGPGGEPDPFVLFDVYFKYPEFQPGPLSEYPEIPAELEEARKTHSLAKRNELLRNIIRTATEEVLLVPIAATKYSAVVSENVRGFYLSPTQVNSWNGVSVA